MNVVRKSPNYFKLKLSTAKLKCCIVHFKPTSQFVFSLNSFYVKNGFSKYLEVLHVLYDTKVSTQMANSLPTGFSQFRSQKYVSGVFS